MCEWEKKKERGVTDREHLLNQLPVQRPVNPSAINEGMCNRIPFLLNRLDTSPTLQWTTRSICVLTSPKSVSQVSVTLAKMPQRSLFRRKEFILTHGLEVHLPRSCDSVHLVINGAWWWQCGQRRVPTGWARGQTQGAQLPPPSMCSVFVMSSWDHQATPWHPNPCQACHKQLTFRYEDWSQSPS